MANKYRIRGVTTEQEKSAERRRRDFRSPLDRFAEWLVTRAFLGWLTLGSAALIFFVPALLWPVLIIVAPVVLFGMIEALQDNLPMRMPAHAGVTDYNDPKPGRGGYNKARGLYFLGNEKFTNKELWAAANDMLTHMLVFGTTGSGKTEFLTGLCTNSITSGAGVVFVDPKGTNTLMYQIYLLSRLLGRDDDFLLLNFSTAGKKIEKHDFNRKSNTINPMATGTAESLFDMLASFVPTSQGDNAVFSQRALSFMSSLLYPLAYLRDMKAINLSVRTLRENLTLRKTMELAGKPQKRPVHGVLIPDDVTQPLAHYLNSVAGFKDNQPYERQGEDTSKQHDYAQAYYTRPLATMTDTYGFVYDCDMGEIDYRDVVYNRRIFVVLLPAMEKAAPELKQIGGMILSALKNAIALGLGDKYEGTTEEALDTMPSAAKVPTLMIADEYGYVATEGFAVIPAQARGLGFAFVFAGQDYAGFKRGSETEAEQIVANTKIKVLMTLEDPQTTLQLFQSLAGEASVAQASRFVVNKSGLSYSYREEDSSFERISRIDIMDLKAQTEGEFHLFFKEFVIRGQAFHADLDPKRYPRFPAQINRFLEVERPTAYDLNRKYGFTLSIQERMLDLLEGRASLPARLSNPIGEMLETQNMLEGWQSAYDFALKNKVPLAEAALFGLHALIGDDDTQHKGFAKDDLPASTLDDDPIKSSSTPAHASEYDDDDDDIDQLDALEPPKVENVIDHRDIMRAILIREQHQVAYDDEQDQDVVDDLVQDFEKTAKLAAPQNDAIRLALETKDDIEKALGNYPTPPIPSSTEDDLVSDLVMDLINRSKK